MLKYLLRSILKRSSRNILLVVGLLALSSGLSTYVSANQNASVRVSSAINQHWRGAYDILVRPKDSVQPIEQEYGLVESNYLSVSKSGISVEQWKQIEKLSGVEVAAPVATIGYLRGPSGVMQEIVPPQKEPYFYRSNVVISSTNGYRTITLADTNEYILFDPSPNLTDTTNPRSQGPLRLITSPDNYSITASYDPNGEARHYISVLPAAWTLVAGVDPVAESKLTGLDSSIVEGKYLDANDGVTTEKVPDPATTNYKNDKGVVDVKRRQEDVSNRNMNPDGPNIPIIFATSTYISIPVSIKVDQLATLDRNATNKITQDINSAIKQEYQDTGALGADPGHRLREYLDKQNLPAIKTIANILFDYGGALKPLSRRTTNINLYAGQKPVQLEPNNRAYSGTDMDKTYRPGAISYESYAAPFDTGGMLSLAAMPKLDAQTIISGTGEAAFRSLPLAPPAMSTTPPLDKQPPGTKKYPFTFHEAGSYDLNKLPDAIKNPDPLTYVPLGIYQPPLVQLVRDANGNPLPGGPVTLQPTLNPASFIPGPPLALTNIAAARFFRGDNSIDAIRVRVAGIDSYTPQNIKKVEQVAKEIIEATGLHVDIVAGSSPQNVLVYVPGSPDGKVAPLGYVQEQWTTLGAAASITAGIDQASVLMLGATGLAGLLYLISQSFLSTLARRRELALLQAIGWRRRHVSSLVIGEAGIIGLLGGVCAVVLAVVIAQALGLAAPPEQALGVGAVVFILYLLASIGPALWIIRQPVAELLQRGEVALPSGVTSSASNAHTLIAHTHAPKERVLTLGGAGVWGLALFAWRNLSRRRVRALLAIAGVAIATALLMLLSASLVALSGTLRVTLLGQFVGLEVQPYHYIMVGSAIIISVLTVADHLAVGVLERRHELALLQAIGWRAGAVRVSLLMEGVWLGLCGGIVGALVAIGVGLASRSELILTAWWVVPVGLAVMLLLCALSALYAILLTPRQTLVRAMQQQ